MLISMHVSDSSSKSQGIFQFISSTADRQTAFQPIWNGYVCICGIVDWLRNIKMLWNKKCNKMIIIRIVNRSVYQDLFRCRNSNVPHSGKETKQQNTLNPRTY